MNRIKNIWFIILILMNSQSIYNMGGFPNNTIKLTLIYKDNLTLNLESNQYKLYNNIPIYVYPNADNSSQNQTPINLGSTVFICNSTTGELGLNNNNFPYSDNLNANIQTPGPLLNDTQQSDPIKFDNLTIDINNQRPTNFFIVDTILTDTTITPKTNNEKIVDKLIQESIITPEMQYYIYKAIYPNFDFYINLATGKIPEGNLDNILICADIKIKKEALKAYLEAIRIAKFKFTLEAAYNSKNISYYGPNFGYLPTIDNDILTIFNKKEQTIKNELNTIGWTTSFFSFFSQTQYFLPRTT